MRINEITNTNISDKKIVADCSSFIRENYSLLKNKEYLFRGCDNIGELISYVPTRLDRKPLDTKKIWHNVANEYFQETFGWPYRSAAVFSTNNEDVASSYGNLYIIIPAGDYTICSSPAVEDFTLDVTQLSSKKIATLCNRIPLEELQFLGKNADVHTLESFLYKTSSGGFFDDVLNHKKLKLTSALLKNYIMPNLGYAESKTYTPNSNAELMIKCKGYYAIDSTYDFENHLIESLLETVNK